jgi:hypothetical protein
MPWRGTNLAGPSIGSAAGAGMRMRVRPGHAGSISMREGGSVSTV